MARALTTSEANQYLMSLGYDGTKTRFTWIGDSELTAPFGKTDYYYYETTNYFDKSSEYRWWEWTGTRFSLSISENPSNGRSWLAICKDTGELMTNKDNDGNEHKWSYCTGCAIINYAKLTAKEKKQFIAVLEELAKNKQTYHLEQTNWGGDVTVFGDGLPKRMEELAK